MRSMAKLTIQFALLPIAIKLYNASETSDGIKFNQLHNECAGKAGRIAYDKRCTCCGVKVTNDDIVKGFEYEPDKYAIVGKAEIEAVKLPTNKSIEIVGFVNASEIPATYYESPYFAGPDGPVAQRGYDLLREAMKSKGKVALAKVVLSRGKEEFLALAPEGRGILVHKLRYRAEVRDINDVPGALGDQPVNEQELQIAETLVDGLVTTFDKVEIKDRYQAALAAVIQAKIKGEPLPVETAQTAAPATNILDALKASLKVVSGKTETVKADAPAKSKLVAVPAKKAAKKSAKKAA